MRLSPELQPLFKSVLLSQNWLNTDDLATLSKQTTTELPLEDLLLRQNRLTQSQLQQIFQEVERQAWESQTQKVHLSNNLETPPLLRDTASTSLPHQQERFGPYEVFERLAQGGMGTVYKVRHQETKQIYALKVISSGTGASTETIERFHREVKTNAKLQHPCIVQLIDSGKEAGLHYFCMEYIEGATLEQAIRQGMSVQEGVRILKETLDALNYAHSQGIIHRDLKPANIFITHSGQPKIGDFGLAKDLEKIGESQHLTRSGEIIGTPAYMAPEQIKGKNGRVDERSDIYSMGACLYQVLTQRPPFDCGSIHELLYHILAEEPTAPSKINSEVSPELDQIVLKALHKEKENRYTTAKDFAQDLDRFLNGRPVLARRSKKPLLHTPKTKEQRSLIFLSVLFSIFFSVGIGIIIHEKQQYQKEKQQLTQQVQHLQKEKERLTEINKRYEQEFFYRLSQRIGTPLIESLENTKNEFLQQTQSDASSPNWLNWVQGLADPNDPNQKMVLEELCQILEQASASQEIHLLLPEYESTDIRPHLEQLEQKKQKGDWEGAVSHCNESIDCLKEKLNTTTPNLKGVAPLRSYSPEIQHYQITLAHVYHHRGSVRYKMNDFFGAIQDYSEALKFHPQYAPLLQSIHILGNLGNSHHSGLLKNVASSLWKQIPSVSWPSKK